MRIAHVITGLELGGAQMMLLKLLGTMDRTTFDPLVISMVSPEPMGTRIAALGIPVQTLGMGRGLPDPRGIWRLVRLLREFGPDLVQTWMYHADLAGALVIPFLGRGNRRPNLVWNIRQSDLDPKMTRLATRLVAHLNARLSHLAPSHIVCCSQRARSLHLGLGYRDEILSVIPNGFDLDRFRPDPENRMSLRRELGIREGRPLIGMAARFDPQKDLPTFVAAAAKVRAARPECRFLLCGLGMDAANTQLQGWLEQAGLVPSFSLLGPRDDVARVLSAMDVFVSSSAYGEGFSNALGEAMACGVPCVVTDVGDSGLIVGDTGATVPPRDAEALAQGLLGLLAEDPEQRARRGQAARARVASEYALPRIAGRYAELYQSLRRQAH
jgi:glycosyltransferase involved in cell wall biosynthesis